MDIFATGAGSASWASAGHLDILRLDDPLPTVGPMNSYRLLDTKGGLDWLAEGVELTKKTMRQFALVGMIKSEVRPWAASSDPLALRDEKRAALPPYFQPVETPKVGSDNARIEDQRAIGTPFVG